jgi:hemolysin activation/secretion protein
VRFHRSIIAASIAVAGQAIPCWAQTFPVPDQTLRGLSPPPSVPEQGRPLPVPDLPLVNVSPGGARVELRSIAWSGNTAFTREQLDASLGPETFGKSYDLAGLQDIADRITALYRAAGYPFAQSFVLQQEVRNGSVAMQVVEGRYGVVSTSGDPRLASAAQSYLRPLSTGSLIRSDALERSLLLLQDVPGIEVDPTIRPGEKPGTGDINVEVRPGPRYGGELGIDNGGDRFTGRNRARLNFYANSPLLFGDRLVVNAVLSKAQTHLGSIDYELPVAASGLRVGAGYVQTTYGLGNELGQLQATGRMDVATAKASYPVLRSQKVNVSAAAAYQYKKLHDEFGATSTSDKKRIHEIPIALRFDERDAIGLGGIAYGSLSVTPGELSLDSGALAADAATARKQGRFTKWNLDLARIQRLPGAFVLYGRASAQHANKNLDSSERFGLGGPYGVRAYPVGEGLGDNGALAQVELRFEAGPATPFVFYDAGEVRVNAEPWDQASTAKRSIAGGGLGVRVNYGRWMVDATSAWRTRGGAPQAEPSNGPQLWFNAGYTF